MSLLTLLAVALSALLHHKLRAILTGLGIVIGIAAVIAMVSAGEGARKELDDRLDRVGKNLILVRSGTQLEAGETAEAPPWAQDDVRAIRKQAGDLLLSVAPVQITRRIASTRYGHEVADVVGSTPEFQQARSWQMVSGRFYTADEVHEAAPVCVLGATARQKLFPGRASPVGELVRVDRLSLRLVGVTAAKGSSPTGVDQDDHVFLPLTTLQHKIAGEERVLLILAAARPDATDAATRAIDRVLRARRHIRAGAAADFEVSSIQEMGAVGVTMAGTLQVLIALIASISLVVGGIGIRNIMLVSVTERTREIGIRMSRGARPSNILTQFLLEAVILALLGGLLGILLGLVGAAGLAHAVGWPLVVSPRAVLLTVLASAGVGVLSGYYPAWKASRMEPVEAMRFD
jgi:putative ABC transport system permease protein